MRRRTLQLRVDPIGCDGHGLCADVLPELIALDDWGYPILLDENVPRELEAEARRAVKICPKLALHLHRADRAAAEHGERKVAAGPAGIRSPRR